MNFKVVIRVIGVLILLEAVMMMFCLIPAAYYGESVKGLLLSIATAIVVGFPCIMLFPNAPKDLGKKEGYFIVGVVWLVFSCFGALPFLFSGTTGSFIDAFFESMSGFTTTGATIFPDVEILPKYIILWRSFMQWVGGMGIIVLTVAIIPMIGVGGMSLYSAEAPGPIKDKIHPRIKDTAMRLYIIYISCTILQVILLMAGGMSFFEAIIVALSSISSGGFSDQNTSVMNMSPYTQYIIILFMFISGVNFMAMYFIVRGKFMIFAKNEELRNYIIAIILFTVAIVSINIYNNYASCDTLRDFEKTVRVALFQVISIQTTTGFVIEDFSFMPNGSTLLFFVLMFFGACAGSTSGSMKIVRITILIKNSYLALKQILHTNSVLTLRINKKPVENKIISSVYAFIAMYIVIFLFGTFLLSIDGHDFYTAFSASALSIGNVGIGLNSEGLLTDFASFSSFSKVVMSILMLIGRLEVFTILILFIPAFWKK